jgi:23S rRNA-/tRNA-specific pseudouridylate synthase
MLNQLLMQIFQHTAFFGNQQNDFQPIKNFDSIDASLVEVLIETGRMHQIRVHAQYVGHPLACDDKYGDILYGLKVAKCLFAFRINHCATRILIQGCINTMAFF